MLTLTKELDKIIYRGVVELTGEVIYEIEKTKKEVIEIFDCKESWEAVLWILDRELYYIINR